MHLARELNLLLYLFENFLHKNCTLATKCDII